MQRRIFAASQGAVFNPDRGLLLLRELLRWCGKPEPRICLLPTARGDDPARIALFYETLAPLPCRPRHQRMFISSADTADFETELLSADIIYVGGGSTLNMLAIWKAQAIDRILHQAYESGTIMAGESAGGLCWFENGSTDSRPGQLSAISCLGWLSGSFCPHYDGEADRRPTFHRMLIDGQVSDGIAADEKVALLFENERFVRAISARPEALAYRVTLHEGKVREEPMVTKYLGAE